MPNFVDDLTALDYPKLLLRASSVADQYKITPDHWNRLCQAAVDLRGAVRNLRATPSVVAAVSASAYGATNLSTLGTIDWYWPVDTAITLASPIVAAPVALHSKLNGGWVANSFRWKNATALAAQVDVGGGQAMSTTAADDIFGVALSSSDRIGVSGTLAASAADSLGFTFRVPASITPRTLRVYEIGASTASGSLAITITARLRDAGTTHTATATGLAALTRIYSVVFNSAMAGDELIVEFKVADTGAGGAGARCKHAGISLGAV